MGGWRRAAALVALLAAGVAEGEDLSGRVLFSYQKFDTDVFRTDGFHQTYELRLQRFLVPTLQYRLSFRGERNDGTADFGEGERVKNTFSQLQPGAELFYTLPRLQVQGTYDLLKSTSSNGILAGSERKLERGVGRLFWTPDAFPALTLQAEKRSDSDRGGGISKEETIVFGALDYSWKALKAGASQRYDRVDDGGVGFARRSQESQGHLAYESSFWNHRVNATASALGSTTTLDERATVGGTVLVPTRVAVAQASNAVDDTPLDGRDRPLVPNAALNDGNLNASAGIDIGPGGTVYQNIGVDLQRVVGIDELRIHVRDASGQLVPLGGSVRWDVFTSGDGLTWSPIAGGARTFFNVPLSRYEVTFTSGPSRFFKVVGFFLNSVEARVTEIEAWYHTEVVSGAPKRTRIRLGSASANVTARPIEEVALTYFGLFNSVSQSSTDRPAFTMNDADQVVSLEVTPLRRFHLTGRYERRSMTQSGDYSQTYRAVTGILRYAMNARLDLSLEGTKTDEDNAGILSSTRGLTLHTFFRLLPTLDVSLDAGQQDQTFTTGQPNAHRTFLSGVSIAQLTRALKVTLQASLQRTRYDAGSDDAALPPGSRDERYNAEVFFRPSQQLALSSRFGWARGDAVSGLTQRYHLEWYPLPGGALSIGGQYDEDIDPYSQRTSRRVLVDPRWTINRHAVLNLSYSLLEVSGTPSSRTKIFYTNLTLTF